MLCVESGWCSSGKWKRWTKRQRGKKAGGGKRLVVAGVWKVGNMVEKQDRLLERFHIYTGVILVDVTFFRNVI